MWNAGIPEYRPASGVSAATVVATFVHGEMLMSGGLIGGNLVMTLRLNV